MERTTTNAAVELAYERLGHEDGQPVLLIVGGGVTMMVWPAGFLDALVGRGFQVARYDNRDTGRSTHFADAPNPGQGAPYRLEDMADDAVAVLDDLGWTSAHIVGVSLGAAIAQILCVRHPQRARSLMSISSAPPDPRMFELAVKKIHELLTVAVRWPQNVDQAVEGAIQHAQVAGSPAYPTDYDDIRRNAKANYERSHGPTGGVRQAQAVLATGNRLHMLETIHTPTVVIHGDKDIFAPPEGSELIAQAIPGARLITIPGMGHDLPPALWNKFIDELEILARNKQGEATTDIP
jgi:pimeloyl-ACP methyl ester carboxylesterase